MSRMPEGVPVVRIYVTADCHLCRVARSKLVALQRTVPFNVESISIDDDDELQRRFAIEVPVVEVDGKVVASGQIDLDAVRAAVNAARIASVRRTATGGEGE
ncbi:MAG: glutaredoxin family protein [Chloroflexi bacterium]|nr:glutaredoxin family protein [Chloroflexota bacterium]